MTIAQVTEGLLWYVAFLFSTTIHEASHAFAAYRLGDRTAYDNGQATLNPLPHIFREPIGTVVVPIISFLLGGWMIGWASVPYDSHWALRHPKRAAGMSLAGPAANLCLVLISALAIRVGLAYGVFHSPESIYTTSVVEAAQAGRFTYTATFLNVLFSLNLILFLFNLLPIPPLDGSGVVSFALSEDRASSYLEVIRNPSFGFVGIMVAWKLFGFIYPPVHRACVNLLYLGEAYYR